MSEDEIELLPFTFLKKYGSFINLAENVNEDLEMEESKGYNNRWLEIKDLLELKTNE